MVDSQRPGIARGAIERNRYFTGRLMTASDLQAEQDYFIGKLRFHNLLHGWGTVCGFVVEPTDPPSTRVVVEPGIALDCRGRAIVLTERRELDLYSEARAAAGAALYVTVEYGEEKTAPAPRLAGSGAGESDLEYTRIREVARLAVVGDPPQEVHEDVEPCALHFGPVCEDPRLVLASVHPSRLGLIEDVQIDNSLRRAAVSTLPRRRTQRGPVSRLALPTATAVALGWLSGLLTSLVWRRNHRTPTP